LNLIRPTKILIDNKPIKEGTFDDWDFLPPREINDPAISKPEDWVDEKFINDPSDVKPEGYDDIPESIPDPDAEQPEDWDTELDGEWEAPIIDNPAYQGPWRPKKIENPAYNGEWEHSKIQNPEYHADSNIYKFTSNAFIGIEIWQVKSGTIFDNFLVTDDATLAHDRAVEILKRFEVEKEKYDEAQEAERKAREAETAAEAEEEEEEEEAEERKDEL